MISSIAEIPTAKRLVVKVGSSSISGENVHQIPVIVDALAALHARGCEVVLVTSGAIASGLVPLKLEARPDDLPSQQAAAAVGQNILMNRWQDALDRFDIIGGQVLLTAGDMENVDSRTNARAAMDRLLELRILPIVNENDAVGTSEIRFGDNDRLAALVAVLVDADALVLLSDVDGLYTKPPHEDGAQRIEWVVYGDDLGGVEFGDIGAAGVGTGGASTKVAAAQYATAAGTSVFITSAALVAQALDGSATGTWFEAKN